MTVTIASSPAPPRDGPRRWAARLAGVALGVLAALTLASVVGGEAAGSAAHAGAGGCEGVVVVVDAAELDGDLTVRCAGGAHDDGMAALRAAGHERSDVPRIPGMVCTIDGRPEVCNDAPDDAYWSYWHGEPDGEWRYATLGAGNHTPESDTVEGWAFGSGDEPAIAPPHPAEVATSTAGEAADDAGEDAGAPVVAGRDWVGAASLAVAVALLVGGAVWRSRRRARSERP